MNAGGSSWRRRTCLRGPPARSEVLLRAEDDGEGDENQSGQNCVTASSGFSLGSQINIGLFGLREAEKQIVSEVSRFIESMLFLTPASGLRTRAMAQVIRSAAPLTKAGRMQN